MIKKKPYRFLCDFPKVYDFMIKNFTIDNKCGCSPTFFEYAQVMHWTEKTQNHRFAIWEHDDEVVAFCWYEDRVGQAYFNLKKGYADLADEMINHAEERLKNDDGKIELFIYASQENIINCANKRGYKKNREGIEGIYDYNKPPLDYSLPEFYSFEKPGSFDMKKMIEASWRGFDNIGKPDGGVERGFHLCASPNATPELDVIVKDKNGDYVCYAGMWWVPQIKLAYLEPLCTVPEHRHKGLAAAALSELYRRTSALGAKYMTGGENDFYFKIGYEPMIKKTVWTK